MKDRSRRTRRRLTRDEVLEWKSGWSHIDRQTISFDLDRIAASQYDVPPAADT